MHSQLDSGPQNAREHNESLPQFYPFSSPIATSSSQSQLQRSGHILIFFGWQHALNSWLNFLLLFVPASWVTTLTFKNSHGLTFAFCVLALIPLVRLHDLSTRELANRIGGARTGLLNGSMSNFVEIVVAISALRKCELRVVQSMLVGSMIGKLLLVLGLCFFAGGINFAEQGFDATSTQVSSSLLSLSVGAVLLPAAYHFVLSNEPDSVQQENILKMSRGVSVLLILIYVAYLIFQLWSHSHLYNDRYNKKSNRLSSIMLKEKQIRKNSKSQNVNYLSSLELNRSTSADSLIPPQPPYLSSQTSSSSEITLTNCSESMEQLQFPNGSTVRLVQVDGAGPWKSSNLSHSDSGFTNNPGSAAFQTPQEESTPEDAIPQPRPPKMSWFLTILLLISVTGAVAVTVDWLVEAMDDVSTTVSKEWVGFILLPTISSVAECITAVRVSVKDELTLSVSVAVGSTIQTALFVIPFTVILAWITHKPLSLLMDPFQSMVLYIAVNTMGYVVADGKSNWLEGGILMCLYVIIAVTFWFYPGANLPVSLTTCTS
ncbi:Sodium/calcium exchanger protein-domain-containing protein [Crepidotus variabilis]|uniref:Sodium/calcium exchanger protein-domain-containing protein n=1 Tax=Crepidotus variabilis TaxID=179855 RepID=A0A9P6JLG0_9AGAR|nr:Sodium/calcium exchanger protein-domain-containing protein [Crepidotus variabilis]